MSQLEKTFAGKRVLITGHTGFKGSWLATWLAALGAQVTGFADGLVSQPSHFGLIGLDDWVGDWRGDVREPSAIQKVVAHVQPDFVFHLAAQALVGRSYADAGQTFHVNVLGTVNVLEALRQSSARCTAVLVTSDKSYDNQEWEWGYRETDPLGGKDPYSGSKGAAELAIRAYVESFFTAPAHGVRVGVGRAGNVIGGGDWSQDRLVPDCVRAWTAAESVAIRKPQSTRPWQHVLEPLSGYLTLAAVLDARPELHGHAFNFGPPSDQQRTVADLIDEMARHWDDVVWHDVSHQHTFPPEAGLLHLNCDKALARLGWRACLSFPETVGFTANWYRRFQAGEHDMRAVSLDQIERYQDFARQRGLPWAQ